MENVIDSFSHIAENTILGNKALKKILFALSVLVLMALAVVFGSPCDIVSSGDLYGFAI